MMRFECVCVYRMFLLRCVARRKSPPTVLPRPVSFRLNPVYTQHLYSTTATPVNLSIPSTPSEPLPCSPSTSTTATTHNNMADFKQFQVPKEQPFAKLECKAAFEALTDKEKLYVHHLSQACWAGSPIVFEQVSPESPDILKMYLEVFNGGVSQWKEQIAKRGEGAISAEDISDFLNFAGIFFANHGNYLSFGDTKLLPRLSKDKFVAIVGEKFAGVVDRIYSLEDNEKMLNFPDAGVSSYYSKNVSKAEIQVVQKFMEEKNISPYNTRLWKNADGSLQVLIAAGTPKKEPESFIEKDHRITVTYGDYSNALAKVADHIAAAVPHAANDNQVHMLEAYVKHFKEGPIDFHKDAQRYWIKDVGPVVETNIGFIESYRDPAGVRGEFEGFVAVVNKETSKKVRVFHQ
jgi:dipeptidyl-peptidase-3